MNNFNPDLERAHARPTDWKFGALSQPGLVSIPVAEREQYLPKGEVQRSLYADFNDCASRSPVNHLEALFTYHYTHGMLPENKAWLEQKGYLQNGKVTFSDRWVALLSGTTTSGNSLKAPLEIIRYHDTSTNYGLIPKKLLPKEDWMGWDDYYDASKITQELKDIGAAFATRFRIQYEQVDKSHFAELLKDDMIGVGLWAWGFPENGVYQARPGTPMNHAVLLYNLPKYQAYDNYTEAGTDADFTKNLAPEYEFYSYGYRVYLAAETANIEERKISLYRQLIAVLTKWRDLLLNR